MDFSDARGEFNFVAYGHLCEYRRFGMRMSPIGLGLRQRRVAGLIEKLRVVISHITPIFRLPPYAVIADAGAGCLWARRVTLWVMFH